MTLTKLLFILAILGHLLCGYCDCLLAYSPSGRFDFKQMQDNEKLASVLGKMPLKKPLLSILLGCLALLMCVPGYFAVCMWVSNYSVVYSTILLIAMAIFFVFVVAHHIFCGVTEWFYIRQGATEEARLTIMDFFKKTSIAMVLCYVGLFVFCVTLFIAVVSGATPLPQWACVFNTLPIFIVLSPFRIVGTGNWSGAIMFLGLLLLV